MPTLRMMSSFGRAERAQHVLKLRLGRGKAGRHVDHDGKKRDEECGEQAAGISPSPNQRISTGTTATFGIELKPMSTG